MKNLSNINLVIAHKLEAEKLLSFFSLELSETDKYKVYRNSSGMQAIISGMGYVNARAATNYLGSLDSHSNEVRGWLNIGIAGHQTADIGACFVADKIVDRRQGKCFFPAIILAGMPSVEVMTVDEPELNYPRNIAYEMEAAGFWSAATKYSSLELVQCLKIISDNKAQPIDKIAKEKIFSIINKQVDTIGQFCSYLQQLAISYSRLTHEDPMVISLLEKYRFTVTEKLQLKRLEQRFSAMGKKAKFDRISSKTFSSGKELIKELSKRLLEV